MSQDAQELERRLRAAHDLKGVVRTLKSLAAASLRPLQDSARALEEYRRVLRLGAAVCFRQARNGSSARNGVAEGGPGAGEVILAFGSDLGMVGAFNEAVTARLRALEPGPGGAVAIWSAGERLQQDLADAGLVPADARPLPDGVDGAGKWVEGIILDLEALRERRGLRSLRLVRNGTRPGGGTAITTETLLPLELDWARDSLPDWPTRRIPQALPAAGPLFSYLAREELFTALFLACVDSMACEALGRMEAMERAERNLDELQERLGFERNRQRQEAISQELLDLVTAFEAVRGDQRSERKS